MKNFSNVCLIIRLITLVYIRLKLLLNMKFYWLVKVEKLSVNVDSLFCVSI